MGRDHGEVQGSTRILNNGSNASRYNIVLLAEGYTEGEQDLFNQDCEDFVAALSSDKWLRGMASAFNVHRVNVASDESGTDDPDECDDGDDDAVDTYFDSGLCTGFPVTIRRLMHYDTGLATEVLDDEVPEWDVGIVVVNTSKFGGAGGGRIAITTNTGGWTSVALHELGHSAFGLADEYDYWSDCDEDGHDHPGLGLEPWEPNLTRALHGLLFEPASAAEHVKWGHLIAPSTNVPTLPNGSCGNCPTGANPLATADEIGLFEGAGYYHCDLFRPAFECRMRNNPKPYCLVCIQAAHTLLRPHLTAGARLAAEVDEIDLGDICSGSTATASFRIANLGTVFATVQVETTVNNLNATVTNFGVPSGSLSRDDGLIPGQPARVNLTFGPLDLPSSVDTREIDGEIRVLEDGDVRITLPFRVAVHTPRAAASGVQTLLNFGDVAVGLTMYRRLRITNQAGPCPRPLNVIVDQLTGQFSFIDPLASEVALSVAGFATGDVYISFTASNQLGQVPDGSLRLRTDDPNLAEMFVTLRARVVGTVPVDSVLVIDRSRSMEDETGEAGSRKIDHAMFAVDLFTSLLRADDRIGLVRFNQHSSVDDNDLLVDLTLAGGAGGGRELVQDVLAAGDSGPLNPAGTTSIGAGMLLGSSVLEAAVSARRSIVVLTDGRENRGATIDEARAEIENKIPAQRVFAVGFGLDQLSASMETITTESGGTALVTGDLVADKEFLLQKLFVQILSDEGNWSMVRDPVLRLESGASAGVSVRIGETDLTADFIVAFRPSPQFPKYMRTWLRLPNGAIINPDNLDQFPGSSYTVRGNHLFYRVPLPPLADDPRAHLGRWRVWVANDSDPGEAAPLTYAVMARAYGNLRLEGKLVQHRHQAGTPMEITLRPFLYGLPAEALEPVRARVTLPGGQIQTIDLPRAAAGVYRTRFRATQAEGPYHFDCTAGILTPSGIPVTRTRYLGGFILPPPKGEKPKPGKDPDRPLLDDFLRDWLRRTRS